MMKRVTALLGVVVAWSLFTAGASADERFTPLLAKVPGDANALMMVDVASVLQTDMADKLGWGVLMEMRAQAHEIAIPPAATMWVRATQVDLVSSTAVWDLSVMQLKAAPDPQGFAQREGGRTDTIGDAPAVWSPRDFYAVDMGSNTVAVYAPANRQTITRWYQSVKNSKAPSLSPYLSEVAKAADLKATQMVFALDVEGLLSVRELKADLAMIEVLQGKVKDLDQLANAIAGLRGLNLAIAFSDKAHGTMTIDFADDVAFMQPYARDLVVHVLKKRGMLVIEVQNWETTASGKTVTLSGPLFSSGLRRVSSFFDAPQPDVAVAKADAPATPEGTAPPAPEAPKEVDPVAASQAYFKAVTAYLDDVYKAESADSTQFSEVSLWMQKYARKIEQLPIAGVDEQLLDWSTYVSAQLINSSTRMRDVRIQSAKRMAEHSNFYNMDDTGGSPTTLVGVRNNQRNYSRSNNDGYHYDSNNYNYSSGTGYDVYEVQTDVDRYRRRYQEGERKQIGTEEKAEGAHDFLAIMAELKAETANVRRAMTKKYNVNF